LRHVALIVVVVVVVVVVVAVAAAGMLVVAAAGIQSCAKGPWMLQLDIPLQACSLMSTQESILHCL
jgi:hypothetical protein